MPPHVVGEELIAAVGLPAADHLERVMIQQRHSTGPVAAVGTTEIGHEDRVRAAVHGVGTGVTGLLGEFPRFDGPHDARGDRVGLGVEHVGAR